MSRRGSAAWLCMLLLALGLAACGAGSASTGSGMSGRGTGTVGGSAGLSPKSPCNGLASLCGKRLNQIVFPGTHNSFSASDQPGWRFANQKYGIERQLDDGIRALLVDVYFGVPVPGSDLVRTDFAAEGTDATKIRQAVPEQARRAAVRIAGPLGADMPPGKPQLYMCHALCELGAEPVAKELDVIARFLKRHPQDFLMITVEDYVPPRYVAEAFRRAGLAKLAVTLHFGQPLPQLGTLLERHKQLAVFAEDHGGSPAWYMKAFEFIQDTPLGATRPRQLSCERGRGRPDSPLLMINHWIPPFPPSPRINAAIGRPVFMRRRITQCMSERHADGAIVAVDFYQSTSVVSVAQQLNRSASG